MQGPTPCPVPTLPHTAETNHTYLDCLLRGIVYACFRKRLGSIGTDQGLQSPSESCGIPGNIQRCAKGSRKASQRRCQLASLGRMNRS